ncbi:hypothetical protein Tco_1532499 [Tanacetum coccineum]
MADTQADIIHSQGLPRHSVTPKIKQALQRRFWDKVEMLYQDQDRTYSTKEEDLFDGRTLSCYWKRSIHDYFVAFPTSLLLILNGFQKHSLHTHQQPASDFSNSRTHARCMMVNCTEPIPRKLQVMLGNAGAQEAKKIKLYMMEAKEKGDVLDAEAEAVLADVECTAPYDQPQALTTTNMFQANHEDAYDSDVDEGPNAAVAFMAKLSPLVPPTIPVK